jgi:hypothetical protein
VGENWKFFRALLVRMQTGGAPGENRLSNDGEVRHGHTMFTDFEVK